MTATTWKSVLTDFREKLPIELALSSAAAFSIFSMSDKIINFGKWIRNWTEYWGDLWTWLLNFPLAYLDMYIEREIAVASSMYILLSFTLLRGLQKYKYRYHKIYQIKMHDIFFSLVCLIVVLTIIIINFFKIYIDTDGFGFLSTGSEFILFIESVFFNFLLAIYYFKRRKQITLWGLWVDDPVTIKLFSRVGIIATAIFSVNILVIAYENAPSFPSS